MLITFPRGFSECDREVPVGERSGGAVDIPSETVFISRHLVKSSCDRNIRQSINQRKVIWRRHAIERMLERGLSRNVVLDIASNGEVIEDHSTDRPTPTALLFGWDKKRPIHVVCPLNPMGKLPSSLPTNQV